MSEEKNKKITKRFDNLLTGVIIGGAVGSVLGLTLAPRKGSETRKIIKDKGMEVIEKGKEIGEELLDEHHEQIESAKMQIKKSKKGLIGWIRGFVKGKARK